MTVTFERRAVRLPQLKLVKTLPRTRSGADVRRHKQRVDISVIVFVCVFSGEDKASGGKFCKGFIGVLGRQSPILGNFTPQKPKIGRIGQQRAL